MDKTITIQIGNSDDKLTQKEWSEYWKETCETISDFELDSHFSAGSNCYAPWQNHCWVVVAKETDIPALINRLTEVRKKFNQDSIALTVGDTVFI